MTENIVLFIVILIFLYFLTTGMYISSLLFFVGILGIYLIGGTTIMSGFLQGEPAKCGG